MYSTPALASFERLANERMQDSFHDGFFSLEESLQRVIFETNVLEQVARDTLLAVRDSRPEATGAWSPGFITLARGHGWTLGVGTYYRQPQHLYALPNHAMLIPLGCQPLVLDYYARAPVDEEGLPTMRPLAEPERRSFGRGELARVDARREFVDVVDPRRVFAVRWVSDAFEPTQTAYDRTTRVPQQTIAASAADSELVAMARALGAMGRTSSIPVLESMFRHPHHFVRWAALQALYRVSRDHAMPLLDLAQHDAHAHVRRAARKALAMATASREN